MPNGFFGQNLQILKPKKEHHHRILHIRNRLGTKFQPKLTVLTFWTKLTQKEYFQSKKEDKKYLRGSENPH